MFRSLLKKVGAWLYFGSGVPILSRKQLLKYAPVGSMVCLLKPTEDQSLPCLIFPVGSFKKVPDGYDFIKREDFTYVAKVFYITGYDYTPIMSCNGLAPVVVGHTYNAGLIPRTWQRLEPCFDPKMAEQTAKLKSLAYRYLHVYDIWARNKWLKES